MLMRIEYCFNWQWVSKGVVTMKLWTSVLVCLLSFLPAVGAYAVSGKEIYAQSCVACHGASGEGAIPGVPSFVRKNSSLNKSDQVLLDHMEYGYQSPGSSMTMPPKGGNPSLTREDLKKVLNYIQRSFGQKTSLQTKSLKGSNKPAMATAPSQVPPSDPASIVRGAKLWAVTCSGCHRLRSPNEYTAEQWHTIMLHMRVQAHLTGQQTRDILHFLQSSS